MSYGIHDKSVSEALALYDSLNKNKDGEFIPAPRAKRGFTESQVLSMAAAISANYLRRKQGEFVVDSSDAARKAIQFFFGNPPLEQFGVLWLDEKLCLIKTEILFQGTIDGASVYPRALVKNALDNGAKYCIAYHNHPSGSPIASKSDIVLTDRLKTALGLIGVQILDHFIVGDTLFSFADNNLL